MSNQIDGKKFNFTKLKQQSNTIVIYQIAKFFFIFRFFFFYRTTKTGKEMVLRMDGSIKS